MGNGMLVIVEKTDADDTVVALQAAGIEAKVAGSVTSENEVSVAAFDGSVLL